MPCMPASAPPDTPPPAETATCGGCGNSSKVPAKAAARCRTRQH